MRPKRLNTTKGILSAPHVNGLPFYVENDVASSLPCSTKRNNNIGKTMPFALLWCLFWMGDSLHARGSAKLLVILSAYNIHILLPVAQTMRFNIWFGITLPIDKLGMQFGHTDPP